ncbi:MAG TPA: ATP-binding protein [Methylibium sp.]|nr:ATP-binding protein [Methylibium sp.]
MPFLLRALLLFVLAGAACARAAAEPVPTLTLATAQAIELSAPSAAPPAGGHAQVVMLPHVWVEPQRRVTWYRLAFDTPPVAPGTLLAAYLPRACSNLEVYLNGQLLHRGGRLSEPITRNCYQPQLVTLPAALLQPLGNRLDVQVVGYPLPMVASRQRAGGLSEVLIGPQPELAARQSSQLFWSITLAQIAAAALVLVGALMLALAWARRIDYLGWFGLLAIGWAVVSARLWWREVPFATLPLELATCIAFVPLASCALLFLLRYAGVRRPALEAGLAVQCLLLPGALIALAALAPQQLFAGASASYTLLALEVVAAIGLFLWRAWRHQRSDRWAATVLFGFLALAVVVEVAIQHELLDGPDVRLIHFVIPLLLCALAFRLVQVFARALGGAETARSQLEQRVREISVQIERNFAHLAEARVEQVAEKERKRIAADLHDDLGAKLLTIVHTSADERISTLAREALEEMRLSVRGIAGKPVQLADALADWRAETVSRLGEAGIEVEWSGDEPDEPRTLPARMYVQTTRILREATSNLIKHSGASRAGVSCRIGEDLRLVIRDNGRGIPMELDGRLDRGHGMASMKHRAKQMQGQCLVESGPGYGTVIRLTLPL